MTIGKITEIPKSCGTNGKCDCKCQDCVVTYRKSLLSHIPKDLVLISDNFFFERDGTLYVTLWSTFTNSYIDIKCNPNSPLYKLYLELCATRHKMYETCKCINKDTCVYPPYCNKHGCHDLLCYLEMKHGRAIRRF